MLIDWFTVAAQALNFIVLAWLLKRFLYKPVLDAVDAREALIAKQVADAQATQQQAQAQRAAFQLKSDSFDEQRAQLLVDATQAADAERKRLFAAARTAADEMGKTRQAALQAEALQLQSDLRERAGREVFAISRQALADLASASLEERMVQVFISRIAALDANAHDALAGALKEPAATALVRSAFELPGPQQAAIQAAVTSAFGTSAPLRFETSQALVSGIELVAGGQKVSWSIARYLDALEHAVSEVVAQQAGVVTAAP